MKISKLPLSLTALCLLCALSLLGQNQPAAITVAKDGSGDYTSIQTAIQSAKAYPYEAITIYIKNGVYTEKVHIPAWNPSLRLVGESRDSTIIRFGDYFGGINKGRNSTFMTATLQIDAADITCRHLTIDNSAGPVGQAVALYISGDRCLVEDCKILGHQDTFFATGENTRALIRNCFISGTTDFIFGDATTVFMNCQIHCLSDSYITAASTNKDQPYGLVFKNCEVTAAPGVHHVLLGRTWRRHAKTVWLNTVLGDFIAPAGWDNWRDSTNNKSAFYAEYNSSGKGANPKGRVTWAHQLSTTQAAAYSLSNIFNAGLPPGSTDAWQP